MDRVLRFEELPDCVTALFAEHGHDVELPHFLQSDRKPFDEYYDDDLRRCVAARYADDFRRFGYAVVDSPSDTRPPR